MPGPLGARTGTILSARARSLRVSRGSGGRLFQRCRICGSRGGECAADAEACASPAGLTGDDTNAALVRPLPKALPPGEPVRPAGRGGVPRRERIAHLRGFRTPGCAAIGLARRRLDGEDSALASHKPRLYSQGNLTVNGASVARMPLQSRERRVRRADAR